MTLWTLRYTNRQIKSLFRSKTFSGFHEFTITIGIIYSQYVYTSFLLALEFVEIGIHTANSFTDNNQIMFYKFILYFIP